MEQIKNGLNGLPAWARIIGVLGFPIAIALFLLLMFSGTIGSPITDTQATTKENNILLKDVEMIQDEQTKLLRAICRNTAATELSMLECDR